LIRRAYPFRDLSLGDFADCLQYLSGGRRAEVRKDPGPYAPRLAWRDHAFSIADRRTEGIYRRNVGTIVSEPIREVRHENGSLVGAVNDWFADQLQAGDRFLLAGKSFQVTATRCDVLEVVETACWPVRTGWEGGLWPTPQALAERLWAFRARAKETLLDGRNALRRLLADEYGLDSDAAQALEEHFERQETVSEIPSRGLLVEACPSAGGDACLYCLHLPLALPACEALARLLAWRIGHGAGVQTSGGCLVCTLAVPEAVELDAVSFRRLLAPANLVEDLERAFAQSSLLRRRFQAAAETGLLVLRQPLGARRRVGGRKWAARRLFNWLRFADPQFPLLRQASRELLDDCCDVATLLTFLQRRETEPIHLRRLAEPSPFVAATMPAACGLAASPWLSRERLTTSDPLVHDHWLLTPCRAAVHLPTATAVIADVHLGYAEARRGGGDAIPCFGWYRVRQRLAALFAAQPIRRLIVAGDLVEDSRFAESVREFVAWIRGRDVELLLVPGNHDRGLPPIPGLVCHPHGYRLGDWLISHEAAPRVATPQIVGHVHPVVKLPRPTPCYVMGPQRIILPAFSDDAAGAEITRQRGWQRFAIVGDAVRAFPWRAQVREHPGDPGANPDAYAPRLAAASF
jgi:metallophosphoesterase superfamily enzyme